MAAVQAEGHRLHSTRHAGAVTRRHPRPICTIENSKLNPVATRQRLALIFSVLLAVYSIMWMRAIRTPPAATLGFELRYRPVAARLDVVNIVPDGPAARAGLRKDDRIRAVDGAPITSNEPLLALRSRARPGGLVRLDVERSGKPSTFFLTARALDYRPNLTGSWLPPAIGSAIQQALTFFPLPFLIVAVTVLLQRPDDPHAWLLAVMLGGFMAAPPLMEIEHRLPPSWRGIIFAFWALLDVPLAAIVYAFFSVFPAHSPLDRRVPWLKYVGIGLSLAMALPLAISCIAHGGSFPLWWLEEQTIAWRPEVGVLLSGYSVGFCVLALVSLALNAFGQSDVRRKTRVILFGMTIGTLPIMVLQVLISTTLVQPSQIPFLAWALSVLALFAIPVSLGYAVVKHRAMEIPALLRRSARYVLVRRGMVTMAVLVGLAVTFGFARVVGNVSDLPGDQLSVGLLAGSLFGGLLALAGQRVWLPAAERLDRAFFRGAYDARRLLQTLAYQTRTATDRSSLAALIDDSVVQALHPQSLLVFLRGSDDWTFTAAAHEGLSGADAQLPATPIAAHGAGATRPAAAHRSRAPPAWKRRGPPSSPWRRKPWCRSSAGPGSWKAYWCLAAACRTSPIPAKTSRCSRRSARRPVSRSRTSGLPRPWPREWKSSAGRRGIWKSRATCSRSFFRRTARR